MHKIELFAGLCLTISSLINKDKDKDKDRVMLTKIKKIKIVLLVKGWTTFPSTLSLLGRFYKLKTTLTKQLKPIKKIQNWYHDSRI